MKLFHCSFSYTGLNNEINCSRIIFCEKWLIFVQFAKVNHAKINKNVFLKSMMSNKKVTYSEM